MLMKNRIYKTIEHNIDGLNWYDILMIIAITISIFPLIFKNAPAFFMITDKIAVTIFIIDYGLRIFTANIRYADDSVRSYLRYPFSMMAIIDLLSILPSFTFFSSALKILRLARLIRMLKVIRIAKFARYSRSMVLLSRVLKRSKDLLVAVGSFAVIYILISALIIFTVEPQSFDNFFDAVYWATVSLTTVGYGDLYPVTTIGRLIAMLSSFFGIAVIALPAGVVTAGYIEELGNEK